MMQATWLTRDSARQFYNIASRNALEIVMGAFPDWPESRCAALLEICKFNWDRGPIPTAAILSRTADLILSAWETASLLTQMPLSCSQQRIRTKDKSELT